MTPIIEISNQDLDPTTPGFDGNNYTSRTAARAVLLDESDRVWLMNVSKRSFYKLPGGGVDEGEDIIQGLQRELLEEVGCRAQILAELGTTLEYRQHNDGGLKQTSHCYLARQIGELSESTLDTAEMDDGMFAIQVEDIDAAIALVESGQPDSQSGEFMQMRDAAILKAAKEHLA